MKRLLEQAKHEYSERQRLLALAVEGIFFIFLLPWLLMKFSGTLDGLFNLPRGVTGWLQIALGVALTAAGCFFALWSIYAQFTRGRGTPVPIMATQKLIITPPYSYCRNPMALGTFGMYLGVAVIIGSWSAAGLVLLGAVALSIYIKVVEEKEMEARFGSAYEVYRRSTPFLFPRLFCRR